MKRIVTALALLCVLAGTTAANPAIRHAKISAKLAGSDPTVIGGPDWNADHVVDPTAMLAAINIIRVSADPNGTIPSVSGSLAWDMTNGQLWQHTGGSVWTPFVRADGGTAGSRGLIAFLGDSNYASMGVTTDNAARENQVLVANQNVLLDKIYATSSNEPIPLTDMGRGFLRAANASTFPGFGPELSFGREIYTLFNGFNAPVTVTNTPWLVSFSIAGVQVNQFLPASTYGQATPAFGGANAYNAFKARVQSAQAASGRKLSLLISNLGPNDGADVTLAGQVAAHWATLATQIKADFPGVQIILAQMSVNADVAFRPTTVRAQLVIAASAMGATLVNLDDLTLNSDNLHRGSDKIWTEGGRYAAVARGLFGLQGRASSVVAVRGYGTPEYNATTLKPRAFPLAHGGDRQLLACGSMKNSGGFTVIPSPTVPATGWTSLGNTSQAIGGQTQGFALFSRFLTQADIDTNLAIPPGAQILLSNDENYCQTIDLFGPFVNPVQDGSVVAFANSSFGTGSVTAGGVTTTQPNSMVMIVIFTQGGGLSPTEQFTVTNANLTNLTIIKDAAYVMNSGNYGVLTIVVGYKATAGATGNTTITPGLIGGGAFNAAPAGFTVAFKTA